VKQLARLEADRFQMGVESYLEIKSVFDIMIVVIVMI